MTKKSKQGKEKAPALEPTGRANGKVSAYALWVEAGEDGARYRELLREKGLLVQAPESLPQNLPCGWPGNARSEIVEDWR